jgi:hypothetical protein
MHLPITVYQFNRKTNEYCFSHCLLAHVPGSTPPAVLNCSTGMGILRDGLELLKAAMRAPAVLLVKGSRTKALSASGEEVASLFVAHDVPVVRAFEMTCINLCSSILNYRLRRDGVLVLASCSEDVNCLTCHVPESMCARYLKRHLEARAEHIRKLIRDRRLVVEMGSSATVYSMDTLHRRRVLGERNGKNTI